jgi:DeoR/GlpR family transcriptional regulator of sugar metabolism
MGRFIKLTPQEIKRVCDTWRDGEVLISDMCKRFKVSEGTIKKIVKEYNIERKILK